MHSALPCGTPSGLTQSITMLFTMRPKRIPTSTMDYSVNRRVHSEGNPLRCATRCTVRSTTITAQPSAMPHDRPKILHPPCHAAVQCIVGSHSDRSREQPGTSRRWVDILLTRHSTRIVTVDAHTRRITWPYTTWRTT